MTGINRRKFCQLLGGTLLLPGLAWGEQQSGQQPLFASAAKDKQGGYHLYLISEKGEVLLDHRLPDRAHHTEVHPTAPLLACIARRPGTFIDIVDYQKQTLLKRIIAAPGRHFFGHGIFTEDGRYLVATENDIAQGQGRVVIREVNNDYEIVADYPSQGIGPHELVQQPGSNHLLVANGGIHTHPDHGRKKLNLDTMQPSLAVFDIHSGKLIEQQLMPAEMHQLSIRHMDTNREGTTVIALQYQGGPEDNPALVAVHRSGQSLKLLRAEEPVQLAMKRYCGSARFDSSGRFAAVSAPRGDLITFWDLQEDKYISSLRSRDGCGVAAMQSPGVFLITTGAGRTTSFNLISGEKTKVKTATHPAWDNHLAVLTS